MGFKQPGPLTIEVHNMRKKIWFYLCIIQSILILGTVILLAFPALTTPKLVKVDLTDYIDQFSAENNYSPISGYIPNVETANIVGTKIIDTLTGNKSFGVTTVKYDEINRLWLVERGYLFGHSGYIIIEQDSGTVIKALLTK